MKLAFDDFEAWIRDRSSGCMEPEEIDELCKGDMDMENGEYTFRNQSVQSQWEAWQASKTGASSKRPIDGKRQIEIVVPIDRRLHAHNKGSWRAKAEAVKQLRALARVMAAVTRATPIKGRCVVDYSFSVPDRRRRDLANLVQGCKAAIDGVVDSGLIPGDHWEVLAIGKIDASVGERFEVKLVFREI